MPVIIGGGLMKELNKKIPYIMIWIFYYAWVIVFTSWWTSSDITDKLMGSESRVLLHSLNLLSSAIFVWIIKPDKFKKYSSFGGVFVLLFSILSMIQGNALFHIISIVLLSISLGLLNISILIPMVYILNHTEKLIAIVGSNFLISILVYLQEIKFLTISNGVYFSFILLIISVLPILFFNKEHLDSKKIINSKLNKTMYLTIILNCAFAILCKGIGKAFVMMAIDKTALLLNQTYYIGGIIGCFISFLIYKSKRLGNYFSWNIIFGLFTVAMMIYGYAEADSSYHIFSILMGFISTMGMINMYYCLGVIGQKYANHSYVKVSIVAIGLLGGVVGTRLGNNISNFNDVTSSRLLSIISVGIILLFLVLSPNISNVYYNDEIDKKEREKNNLINNLKKYNLTPREKELCLNLLKGYTLRQSAIIMGIKYHTLNTYYKNIYKKLKINSKIELINKLK